MKLSFIVPVYNVEKYLAECFYSIYSQIDNHCEIILVDDGSKDFSGKICDDFAGLSRNVHVIHKENGGLASARNVGLNAAKGDYVSFIDSDDHIAQGSIERIIEWIDQEGADLCFMQAKKIYPDGIQRDLGDCIERQAIKEKEKKEVLNYLSTRPKFPGSSCTKIYRRSFLTENYLRFPLVNIQAEDLGFVRDCIMKANSYDCLEIPFYEYRQHRTGSITNTTSERSIHGLLFFVEETIQLYSYKAKALEPYGKYALSFGSYEYLILLLNYARSKRKDIALLNRIKKYKWILDYAVSKRQKLIKGLIAFVGIDLGAKGIELIYTIKTNKK